ncbi:MAG: DUF3098 domain-containing protein [Paludibacteraceae bacterium]|nr:DUF3098 domain-containing protein [Paludibacteraceae bacterium]
MKNLQKINFILMGISFVIIILGFALMIGPASGEEYNPDIFSVRRITVGPMIALFGFIAMIVAILYRPKNKQ